MKNIFWIAVILFSLVISGCSSSTYRKPVLSVDGQGTFAQVMAQSKKCADEGFYNQRLGERGVRAAKVALNTWNYDQYSLETERQKRYQIFKPNEEQCRIAMNVIYDQERIAREVQSKSSYNSDSSNQALKSFGTFVLGVLKAAADNQAKSTEKQIQNLEKIKQQNRSVTCESNTSYGTTHTTCRNTY